MASPSAADIAEALGGAYQSGDWWRCRCPVHNSSTASLALRDSPYGLKIKCWAGCDRDDVRAELHRMGLLDAPIFSADFNADTDSDQSQHNETQRIERARAMWGARQPVTGTVIETFLREAREIPLQVIPPSLGYLPAGHFYARHRPSGSNAYAVMIAAVVDHNGTITAAHRTWIKPDGSDKAAIEPNRMTLGSCSGAAVRLGDWYRGSPLVIAEGIESALAASELLRLPAWAALSADGIENLILPDIIRDICIAVDHDANGIGEDAARSAALRWLVEGRRVELLIPNRIGADPNDLLRENLHGRSL